MSDLYFGAKQLQELPFVEISGIHVQQHALFNVFFVLRLPHRFRFCIIIFHLMAIRHNRNFFTPIDDTLLLIDQVNVRKSQLHQLPLGLIYYDSQSRVFLAHFIFTDGKTLQIILIDPFGPCKEQCEHQPVKLAFLMYLLPYHRCPVVSDIKFSEKLNLNFHSLSHLPKRLLISLRAHESVSSATNASYMPPR